MQRPLVACLIAALALVAASSAAEPSDEERERAVELGRHAVELYNQRRWVDAHERFAKADALVHSPVFVLYMARAKRQLGELSAAKALYERVANETPPAGAPSPWTDARRDAGDELTALLPLIPRLTIVVQAPAGASVRLWLDDRSLEGERDVAVDPGDHRLGAQCEGLAVSRTNVRVAEGAHETVTVSPSCVAPPAIAAPIAAPIPLPSLPAPIVLSDDPTQRYAGISLVAIGGTALAVALVTGPMAVVYADDLASACDGDLVCPPARQDDVDTYYDLAHATTASLAIGGAAVLAGIITWATAPSAPTVVSLTPRGMTLRF